jgi:hypothetical protein
MSAIKVQSDWKNVNGVFVKVAGQWRTVTESYIKVNGQWRLTNFSTGPTDAPQMTHNGFGQFRVVNYDSSLLYEAEYVSGNVGSVSFSNGVFSLGSTNVAYNVYSRFVANGPRSPAGYMQRTPITFTFIERCNYISQTCFREINEDYPATPIYGTLTGNVADCNPYGPSCAAQASRLENGAADGNNDCFCIFSVSGFPDFKFFIGKGLCPGGWYNCGNRCCIDGQLVGYSCPSGGSLSGTTCIRRRQEPFECGYWQSCNNKNPVPAGYTESGGEWWRVTR